MRNAPGLAQSGNGAADEGRCAVGAEMLAEVTAEEIRHLLMIGAVAAVVAHRIPMVLGGNSVVATVVGEGDAFGSNAVVGWDQTHGAGGLDLNHAGFETDFFEFPPQKALIAGDGFEVSAGFEGEPAGETQHGLHIIHVEDTEALLESSVGVSPEAVGTAQLLIVSPGAERDVGAGGKVAKTRDEAGARQKGSLNFKFDGEVEAADLVEDGGVGAVGIRRRKDVVEQGGIIESVAGQVADRGDDGGDRPKRQAAATADERLGFAGTTTETAILMAAAPCGYRIAAVFGEEEPLQAFRIAIKVDEAREGADEGGVILHEREIGEAEAVEHLFVSCVAERIVNDF